MLPGPYSNITILNDSSDFEVPGNVQIFHSRHEAARSLEPIDVERALVYALSASGGKLESSIQHGRVVLLSSDDERNYEDTLRKWLVHAAMCVQETRFAQNRAEADFPTADARIIDWIRYIIMR